MHAVDMEVAATALLATPLQSDPSNTAAVQGMLASGTCIGVAPDQGYVMVGSESGALQAFSVPSLETRDICLPISRPGPTAICEILTIAHNVVICTDGGGAIYCLDLDLSTRDAISPRASPVQGDADTIQIYKNSGGIYQLSSQAVKQQSMLHTCAQNAENIGIVLKAQALQVCDHQAGKSCCVLNVVPVV
jgi:hypothetical protein